MKLILALLLLFPSLAFSGVTNLKNPEEVVTELSKPGPVVILYYATWCGACDAFKPVYEKLAIAMPDVRFFSLDSDVVVIKEHYNKFQYIPTVYVGKSHTELRNFPCEVAQKDRTFASIKAEIKACLARK